MRTKHLGIIVSLVAFAAVLSAPGVAQAAWLSEGGSQVEQWQSSGHISFSPPLEEFNAYPECNENVRGYVYSNSKESGATARSIYNPSIEGVGQGEGNCGPIWTLYTWRVESLADEEHRWGVDFDSKGGVRLSNITGIEEEEDDVRYRISIYDYAGESLLGSCVYKTDEFVGAVGPFGEGDLQGLKLEAKMEAANPEECEFWNSSITAKKYLYPESDTHKTVYLTE
jgi:hypothetical protein